MEVQFTNIPISLDAMVPGHEHRLRQEIAKACGLPREGRWTYRLLRKSVDARKKDNVHFVLSVVVEDAALTPGSLQRSHLRKGVRANVYEAPPPVTILDCSSVASGRPGRPIIVGSGPAGLFSALYLARAGLRPRILERGSEVGERIESVRSFFAGGPLDPQTNIQFGEGGAGTFSDGKLNTGTRSPFIRFVLEQFVEAGAPESILTDAKPHIGTDVLVDTVRGLRKRIIEAGGEFSFNTLFKRLELAPAARKEEVALTDTVEKEEGAAVPQGLPDPLRCRRVTGVVVEHLPEGSEERIETDTVLLAIGHSARDTYQMLYDIGVSMERKPFAVGVRVEHEQAQIDRAQYGRAAGHEALGPADYKLAVHNRDGRGVYTFCMCPGGTVVAAASEPGGLCVNGMSTHNRDGANANSALLVSVAPEDIPGDHPLESVAFQRALERAAFEAGRALSGEDFAAPVQTLGDFLEGESGHESKAVVPSYPRAVAWTDLRGVLPSFVVEALEEALPALERKLHGFADPEAVMTAVEARSSAPIRLVRDRTSYCAMGISGLYPVGEGAGYAGGIMSAATDGLRAAEALCQRLLETL